MVRLALVFTPFPLCGRVGEGHDIQKQPTGLQLQEQLKIGQHRAHTAGDEEPSHFRDVGLAAPLT